MKDEILKELQQSRDVLDAFIADENNIKAIENAANIMINCIKNGGKIIACGNGGSMSDAMHFASELTGRYRKDRRPLPAIAISDPGHISCVGNDYGYEEVFSRYLQAHSKEEDVILFITTSGNSENINYAHICNNNKSKVIALTGNNGGQLRKEQKTECLSGTWHRPITEICVPHSRTADKIQEMHIKIIHILVMLIEKGVCGEF